AGGSGARTTTATARNGGNGGRGRVWIYWSDFPTVTSINRVDSTTAYAYNYVRWTVVFSKPVTGVDKTDFSLTPGYSAYHTGFEITDVSSSDGGKTWTVTAYTGWITGSVSSSYLYLNLNDDDSIREVGTGMYLSQDANRGRLNGKNKVTNRTNQMAYTVNTAKPVLKKTAVSSSVLLGEIGAFDLSVKGPSASGVRDLVLTDTLPAGLAYASHTAQNGTISVAGQTLTWRIPSLAANATATARVYVRVNDAGTNTLTLPGADSASARIAVKKNIHAHFRMDEEEHSWKGTEGEVRDSGGHDLHGKWVGSSGLNTVAPNPTIASQKSEVVDGFCNAGSFGGSGYVVVPRTLGSKLDYGDEMSATAWIYVRSRPASGGLRTILSNDENYEFHIDSSGKLYWWWKPGTSALNQTSSVVIPNNTWTHVAITFNSAGRQRIYVNGKLDSAATGTKTSTATLNRNNACPFYIGADVDSGNCALITSRNFDGMIDEVRLYEQELSAEEINDDMIYGRQCEDTFDHIRLEHDGEGTTCAPETVTVKACMDAACSQLYGDRVTLNMTPSGWVGGDNFEFTGGTAVRQFNWTSAGNVTLGVAAVAPATVNLALARCFTASGETCAMKFKSCNYSFDAVEPGAAPQTNIFTKLAGVPFNLDVLALDTATTVNPSYTGTLAVDLVDARTADCPGGAGLSTAQSLTYDNEPGRKSVSFSHAGAARKARVRIRPGDGSATVCSTDVFTIRPQGFAVSSPANADGTGANAAATPTVRAGATFSLQADSGAAGYDGLPKANPSLVEWPGAPATGRAAPGTGALEGSAGALSFANPAQAATGNGANGSFTYDEAGYFRFREGGVYDDTFTEMSGDKANGDCVAGSFSNTPSGGKYGCNIANTAATAHFGRFIPDHFDTALTQGCAAGAFTYSRQPFPVTVTAKNSAGAATQNYAGVFARNVTLTARDIGDTLDNPGPGALDLVVMPNSVFTAGTGVLSEKYAFAKRETPPAKIRIRAADDDGISSLRSPAGLSAEGTATIRSGRATMTNAYGSEQLDLPLAFRAEYYDGAGWRTNTEDSCTGDTSLSTGQANAVSLALIRSPATLGGCARDSGNPGVSGVGCAASAPMARRFIKGATPTLGFAGDFNLWLQAPGANHPGSVTVEATMPPWLGNVSAIATFGRNKSSLIYRRESY
ncbi:MAG: DUF11 domain-containing protein, partial [Candidatus Accumulibacter sp.]|nr:DUF11 domain-containing protein [Accumulibacter sp.]